MKKLVIVASTLLLTFYAFGSTVLAQEEVVEKDVAEVNFIGALSLPTGDTKNFGDSLGAKTGYQLGIDVGYIATLQLVTGFNFTYSQFGIDNSPTDTKATGLKHRLYNPNVYVKYYLNGQSNLQPYVRGSVGLAFPKFTTFVKNPNGDRYRQVSYDPALSYGVGLGLFYYTADYGGLYVEGNYMRASTKDVKANYEGNTYKFGSDLSFFDIRAGIRIVIGSGS
ncbi:MAG TPA: hypothetical protein VJ983_05755 [candidate division Zixibacteria bacterium]|nr:hypothetical protein [candidate division Zixibacteria bacterium]